MKKRKKAHPTAAKRTPVASTKTASKKQMPKKSATQPESGVASSSGVRTSGFFSAEDQTPLYYEVRGKGRPLVFLYGLVCRKEHWIYQLEAFEKNYQVITLDYRGHQSSPAPRNDRNLSLDWLVRDTRSLLDHLKLEEVVCLGHSLGVPVAAEVTRQDPRVKAAVFVCGSVTNPFEHMFHSDWVMHLYRALERSYELLPDLTSRIWKWATKVNKLNFILTSQLGFHPEAALERDIMSYLEGVNQTPLPVFQGLIRDYARYDGREHLKEIKVPILAIAGEDDLVTPSYLLEEVAELVPKGKLVTIAQASHNAHTDFPDEVNEVIQTFLTKVKY